ncbi:unnamed protein product [Lasius platythorax]|uniref:Secreted protein n=1 Tax=Lasius platythorax TaxID=488582 RepID=A0AAV2P2L0_9HYME
MRAEPARYARVIVVVLGIILAGTEERLNGLDDWTACLNNHTRDIPVAMKFTECRSKARMYIRQRFKLRGGSTLSSQRVSTDGGMGMRKICTCL